MQRAEIVRRELNWISCAAQSTRTQLKKHHVERDATESGHRHIKYHRPPARFVTRRWFSVSNGTESGPQLQLPI